MCRSIKVLRGQEPPATEEDVRAAALQFVRKVSGFRKPSKANEAAFDRAVAEVTAAAGRLLEQVEARRSAAEHLARVGGCGRCAARGPHGRFQP
ncbi:MAG: DUF2277 domain-containing protein [Bryobacteraceae bacterium]